MKEKDYIDVFTRFDNVTGLFSLKDGASDGYPYDRRDVFEAAGIGDCVPIWPQQVHKSHIEVIGGKPEGPLKLEDTDGVVTNVKGVALTTIHADCLPVYFFDDKKGVIGLAHAGWRGTAAGIAMKTAAKMKEVFGCKDDDINAYIGPGISRCCFETGREVYEEFKEKWAFTDQCADEKPDGKYFIDLKEINRRQLEQEGIRKGNIEMSRHCTCCEPELFCSYRREGGTDKRMGAVLALNR